MDYTCHIIKLPSGVHSITHLRLMSKHTLLESLSVTNVKPMKNLEVSWPYPSIFSSYPNFYSTVFKLKAPLIFNQQVSVNSILRDKWKTNLCYPDSQVNGHPV